MIFVDTSAWYASIIPSDPYHRSIINWLNGNPLPLITTDYVIDETLTLLRARGERRRALALGDRFFHSGLVEVYILVEEDVARTWEIFNQYNDKDWSFTDCSSKVIIEKLGLAKALTLDRHFRQFGTIEVVP